MAEAIVGAVVFCVGCHRIFQWVIDWCEAWGVPVLRRCRSCGSGRKLVRVGFVEEGGEPAGEAWVCEACLTIADCVAYMERQQELCARSN